MNKFLIYIITFLSCMPLLSAEKSVGEAVWSYVDSHRDTILRFEKEGGKLPDKSKHYFFLTQDLCEQYEKKYDLKEKGDLIVFFQARLTEVYAIAAFYADSIEEINKEDRRWMEASVVLMEEQRSILEQLSK